MSWVGYSWVGYVPTALPHTNGPLADSRRGSESTYCGYWSWEITVFGGATHGYCMCEVADLDAARITDIGGVRARGARG
jgi:hypothetical protein